MDGGRSYRRVCCRDLDVDANWRPRETQFGRLGRAAPGSDSVRILAGLDEGTFTDGFGNVWLSDRYYEGGRS